MPSSARSKKNDRLAEAKFEEALAKLEEIVRKMEQGELTLDESLTSFEEGIRLARLCAKKLDEAERRIEILLKKEGDLEVKPFSLEPEGDDH
ncbi:MAG TPA: exodeoxyribonuclease VII small subunit [Syntrophales bacterium]|nr:exodeoxyribonuclease VII small subunit [Syntrophales bacterium]